MSNLDKIGTNPSGSTWCGPAAISAVTGLDYEVIAAAINNDRNRMPKAAIKGAYLHELQRALTALGFRTRIVDFPWRPGRSLTLGQWIRSQDLATRAAKHIVLVTGHFVAVHNVTVSDISGAIHLREHSCHRKQVQQILQVWPEGVAPSLAPPVKPAPELVLPSNASVRNAVKDALSNEVIHVSTLAGELRCSTGQVRSAIDWFRKQGVIIVSLGGSRFEKRS